MVDNYGQQILIKSVWKYLEEERLYIEAVRSTPIGRQSDDLRWRAKAQKDSGQLEASYQLYEEAMRLHSAEDDSAAAAGACHDLAEVLLCRLMGLHIENLLRAETFYRRAQRSAERECNPARSAMTKAALASCLRGQAGMPNVQPGHTRKPLNEAQQLLRDAIRLDEQSGPAALPAAIEHLNTLVNLYSQRDQLDTAVRTVHRIEDKYAQLADIRKELHGLLEAPLPPPLLAGLQVIARQFDAHEQQRPLILLNAADLYLDRAEAGHPNERERGMRLLEAIVADAPLEWADRARLRLGDWCFLLPL